MRQVLFDVCNRIFLKSYRDLNIILINSMLDSRTNQSDTTHPIENEWSSHSRDHPWYQMQSLRNQLQFTVQHFSATIRSQNLLDLVGYSSTNLSWKSRLHQFPENMHPEKKVLAPQTNKNQTPPTVSPPHVLHNFSHRIFYQTTVVVLSKIFNFSITPKSIPTRQYNHPGKNRHLIPSR